MFPLINVVRDLFDVWDNVQKEMCYTSAYRLLYLNKTSIHIGNNFLDYYIFAFCVLIFKIPAVDTGHLYNLCNEFECQYLNLLIIHDCIEVYNTQVKKISSEFEYSG